MKNKLKIILILFIILLTSSLIIIFTNQTLTGQTINSHYTHTIAICNQSNFCEDYNIECQDKKVITKIPTGFVVQHDLDWQDPRGENNELC